MATHFIGFRSEEYWSAIKVFGKPDFFHMHYDMRAKVEIAKGDLAIFACKEVINPYTYDDSSHF